MASGILVLADMLSFAIAMSRRVVTIKVIHEKGLGRRRPIAEERREAVRAAQVDGEDGREGSSDG